MVSLGRRSVVFFPQLHTPTAPFRSPSSSWLKASPLVSPEATPSTEFYSPSTSLSPVAYTELSLTPNSTHSCAARQTKPFTRYPQSSSAAGKAAPGLSRPLHCSVPLSKRVNLPTRATASPSGTPLLGFWGLRFLLKPSVLFYALFCSRNPTLLCFRTGSSSKKRITPLGNSPGARGSWRSLRMKPSWKIKRRRSSSAPSSRMCFPVFSICLGMPVSKCV